MFGPSRGEQGVCSYHFSGQGTSTQRAKCLSPPMGTPVIGRHHFSWTCRSAGTSNPRVHSGFSQGQELEDLQVEMAGLVSRGLFSSCPHHWPTCIGDAGPVPILTHLYQESRALLVTHSILNGYGSSLDSSHPFLGYVRNCSFFRKSQVVGIRFCIVSINGSGNYIFILKTCSCHALKDSLRGFSIASCYFDKGSPPELLQLSRHSILCARLFH